MLAHDHCLRGLDQRTNHRRFQKVQLGQVIAPEIYCKIRWLESQPQRGTYYNRRGMEPV